MPEDKNTVQRLVHAKIANIDALIKLVARNMKGNTLKTYPASIANPMHNKAGINALVVLVEIGKKIRTH